MNDIQQLALQFSTCLLTNSLAMQQLRDALPHGSNPARLGFALCIHASQLSEGYLDGQRFIEQKLAEAAAKAAPVAADAPAPLPGPVGVVTDAEEALGS